MARKRALRVSSELSLPLEAVTRATALLAKRGAGKSNAAVVMAEEMHVAGAHWVAVDPKGDWWGVRADADGSPGGMLIPIFGGDHADAIIEPDPAKARELADAIIDERLSCVIDVSHFSEGEKVRFLAGVGSSDGFAMRLFRRKSRDQEPTHLFLEEAHDYIPQQPKGEKAKLVDAFGKIVTMGRSKGLGATLVTQRSARIHKDVLTQVDNLIVLRIIGPQDRDAVAGWLKYHGESEEILGSLASLEDGEAWLWSPEWLGMTKRFRFRRRRTYDSGATPEVGVRAKAATLADIDLGALEKRMAAAVEKRKEADPDELRKKLRAAERERDQAKTALDTHACSEAAPEQVEVAVPFIYEDAVHDVVSKAMQPHLERIEELCERVIADSGGLLNAFVDGAAELVRQEIVKAGVAVRDQFDNVIEVGSGSAVTARPAVRPQPRPVSPARKVHQPTVAAGGLAPPGTDLVAGARRMLEALARQDPMRLTLSQLATLAKVKRRGGSFRTYLSRLRTLGYIIEEAGEVGISDAGREVVGSVSPTPMSTDEILSMYRARLVDGARRMLDVLVAAHPHWVSREELSEKASVSLSGGSFRTYLSKLTTNGLAEVDGPNVRAGGALYLDRAG